MFVLLSVLVLSGVVEFELVVCVFVFGVGVMEVVFKLVVVVVFGAVVVVCVSVVYGFVFVVGVVVVVAGGLCGGVVWIGRWLLFCVFGFVFCGEMSSKRDDSGFSVSFLVILASVVFRYGESASKSS